MSHDFPASSKTSLRLHFRKQSSQRRKLLSYLVASTLPGMAPLHAQSSPSEQRKVNIGDLTLSTVESGKGPIVILVHGAAAESRFWWLASEF